MSLVTSSTFSSSSPLHRSLTVPSNALHVIAGIVRVLTRPLSGPSFLHSTPPPFVQMHSRKTGRGRSEAASRINTVGLEIRPRVPGDPQRSILPPHFTLSLLLPFSQENRNHTAEILLRHGSYQARGATDTIFRQTGPSAICTGGCQ